MDISKFIEEKERFLAAREEYRTFLRDMTQEKLAVLFQPMWDEFPELRMVAVRGYTPYFNDGDPCVHNQYPAAIVAMTDQEFVDCYKKRREVMEPKSPMPYHSYAVPEQIFDITDFDNEELWPDCPIGEEEFTSGNYRNYEDLLEERKNSKHFDETSWWNYPVYSHLGRYEKVKKVEEMINSLEDLFEAVFDTNFTITLRRDANGKSVVEHKDHDPGH